MKKTIIILFILLLTFGCIEDSSVDKVIDTDESKLRQIEKKEQIVKSQENFITSLKSKKIKDPEVFPTEEDVIVLYTIKDDFDTLDDLIEEWLIIGKESKTFFPQSENTYILAALDTNFIPSYNIVIANDTIELLEQEKISYEEFKSLLIVTETEELNPERNDTVDFILRAFGYDFKGAIEDISSISLHVKVSKTVDIGDQVYIIFLVLHEYFPEKENYTIVLEDKTVDYVFNTSRTNITKLISETITTKEFVNSLEMFKIRV